MKGIKKLHLVENKLNCDVRCVLCNVLILYSPDHLVSKKVSSVMWDVNYVMWYKKCVIYNLKYADSIL